MALTLALAIGPMVPTPAAAADEDVARRTRIVAADGNCPHIPPEFAAIEGAHGAAMVVFVLPGAARQAIGLVATLDSVTTAQAARFGYAGGWLGRMLNAFAG